MLFRSEADAARGQGGAELVGILANHQGLPRGVVGVDPQQAHGFVRLMHQGRQQRRLGRAGGRGGGRIRKTPRHAWLGDRRCAEGSLIDTPQENM